MATKIDVSVPSSSATAPDAAASSSFTQKILQASVTLAENPGTSQPGTFLESGTNTVNFSGLRMSCRIENSGSPVGCACQLRVWGVKPSLLNQLSTLGLVFNLVPKNTLTVKAGYADSNGNPTNMSAVFTGTIISAYGDFAQQPNANFVFDCQSGVADSTINSPDSSFNGTVDVATMLSGLARQLNLGFENNGVSVKLTNEIVTGGLWAQVRKIAEHAGINWAVLAGNVLSIWPKGGNRNTPNVPIISPATGMIAYPTFTQQGIIVRTLFNPAIAFGGLVKVQSSLLAGITAAQQAQGQPTQPAFTFPTQWAVNKLDLALDSRLPRGLWQSTIYGYNPGASKTIIPPP